MKKNNFCFQIVAATAVVLTLPMTLSFASAAKERVSPQETIKAQIGGDEITVTYSRPKINDPKSGEKRKIWGGLVPYGQVWRTGANEATVFTTQKAIQMGNLEIPAGKYTLFTLPEQNGVSHLIINKEVGQWGTKYDSKMDLGRVDLVKADLEKPADPFAISIEKATTGNGGVLKLMWENTQYQATFSFK